MCVWEAIGRSNEDAWDVGGWGERARNAPLLALYESCDLHQCRVVEAVDVDIRHVVHHVVQYDLLLTEMFNELLTELPLELGLRF